MEKNIEQIIKRVTKLQEGLFEFGKETAPGVTEYLNKMMAKMSSGDEIDIEGEEVLMHHISGLQTLSNILLECSNDMELTVHIARVSVDEFTKHRDMDTPDEDDLDPMARAMIKGMDTDTIN